MSDPHFYTGADVRQRFASRLGLLDGYSESQLLIGPDYDGSEVADRRFSVLLDGERNLGQLRASPQGGYVVRLEQQVVVRIIYMLRPNRIGDQLSDYDTAVGPEAGKIMAWLTGEIWVQGMHPIAYVGADRRTIQAGRFLRNDLRFTAHHNARLT